MSLALAKAVTVSAHNDHQLSIQLPPNMKSLVNDNTQSDLIQAINTQGYPITSLSIEWKQGNQNNYQNTQQNNLKQFDDQLKSHLKTHPHTSALLETLQADIDALTSL